MKKLRHFVLLLFIFLALVQGVLYPQLDKLYRSGTIKMEADTFFGAQTDWESLFFDTYKSMAIAQDGSIFVSNNRQDKIYKFSSSGKFLKQWGQRGMGSTDLNSPQRLSMLDGNHLVVNEDLRFRRISFFTIDGKYEKILRTNHSCYNALSLKDNTIAYYSTLQKNNGMEEYTVWVKDVLTGKETQVLVVEIPMIYKIREKGIFSVSIDSHSGNVFLARTKDGDLLVGISNHPDIHIYSSKGKWLRSFRLNLSPLPITTKYIKEYKQKFLDDMAVQRGAQSFVAMVKKASFEKLFPSHLPYYRAINIDSQGNILVFRWLDCVNGCMIQFQVYTPDGKFQNEVVLDPGQWEMDIVYNWEKLIFTDKGIFAFVQRKDDDESAPRIIKINVPGGR